MWFRYFVIYSPWERAGHSVNKFIGCICAKFWWNWSSCFGEEDIIKFLQCIFVFFLFSPLGKEWGRSFEQTSIPLTQGWFEPNLIEVGHVSPEKKSLNFVNEFSLICYYLPLQQGIVLHLKTLILQFRQYIFANLLLSPLGKKYGPSFEQTWIPFTPSLFEIDPAVLEKKTKIWKFDENNDNHNHNNDDDG